MEFLPYILIAGGMILALAIVLTLTNILKLKKLPTAIIALVIVIGFVTFAGVIFLSQKKGSSAQQQINYIASHLIELEQYDVAMDYMLDNETDDKVLQQLELLDLALDNQISIAQMKADTFLNALGNDDIVSTIKNVCSKVDSNQRKQELVAVHSKIKENIKATVDDEMLKNINLVLQSSSGKTVNNTELTAAVDALKSANQPGIKKALIKTQALTGAELVNAVIDLANEDNILSNKILAANVVAVNPIASDDAELTQLRKSISDLEKDINDLKNQLNSMNMQDNKAKDIQKDISQKQATVNQTTKNMNSLNVVRAEQYLDSCTTAEEKNTPLYLNEMAALSYMKNDSTNADKYLQEAVKTVSMDGNNSVGSTSVLMLMDQYRIDETSVLNGGAKNNSNGVILGSGNSENSNENANANNNTNNNGNNNNANNSGNANNSNFSNQGSSFVSTKISDDDMWKYSIRQLSQGIVDESAMNANSVDFTNYVKELFTDYGNGIFISKVETKNYDENYVDIYINVAGEQTDYKAENFVIYDNDEKVASVELASTQEATTTNVCFVMDVSGSMQGDSIENAKKSAINFINSLNSDTRIGLVSFASSATTVTNISDSKGITSKGIDGLVASGGTNMSSGLKEAINSLKKQSGNKVIILMTDGEDASSSKNEMASVKEQLANEGILVYAVGFGSANESYLSDIASATNGKYIGAANASDLATVYATFNKFISNDYHIRYKISNPEVTTRKVTLFCDGYYTYSKIYTVGLSSEEIEADNQAPLTDYFYQIGGSKKN